MKALDELRSISDGCAYNEDDCRQWRSCREHRAQLLDAIEREIAECYQPLPKDADGEYIHIGDVMEGVDKYDSLKKVMGKVITVSFESDGTVDVAIQAWNSDGKSWRRAYLDPNASVYRHHHAPTVEDVTCEFLQDLSDWLGLALDIDFIRADSLFAEYAAKLQLREDA